MLEFDALVLGAGFGGLYQLKRLRELGLQTVAIEKAPSVGGTWYWNRYPGVMSDTESYLYRYSWDKEDLQTYPWSHRYVQGHEVLEYLNHIADKHQLKRDIHFNTTVKSVKWIAERNKWYIESDKGIYTVRYFIGAIGLLSVPVFPDIPGRENFKGTSVHSSRWPQDLDCSNKRVGIIGSGSTGVQIITALAPKVESLTCFQRNPQYTVPSGDRPVTVEERKWINENYDKIYADMKKSSTCFGFIETDVKYASKTPKEREAIFESLWQQGNAFRFMFLSFGDITYSREANEGACNFIRKKISQIVKDPVKARKLQPTQLYARRPLCDNGYYEQFNRKNVEVVNLQETPIVQVTPDGIQTQDGSVHELDIIIYATGFDAVEGAYNQIEIIGSRGETLRQRWDRLGPTSYLGISVPGFPNFFMVTGPQSPFTNLPPAIEVHVELITTLIKDSEATRLSANPKVVIEALDSAESYWMKKCEAYAARSLFAETPSWLFGQNVVGKRPAPRTFLGGMNGYLAEIKKVLQNDYVGYKPIKVKETSKMGLAGRKRAANQIKSLI
ncbi:hypothetical protein N7462_008000 [Penicillium macrosclerotiorum]|uniref:uncharacterized protein n=1 Tax=Penicillium macrosclerotiorum TaxID=303699 RepID=UPI0025497D86|nr:uncharacterized protein N7462_008000 [Penicillium macrosclerotiorum]KAJ5679756.1 hypothetical protein N7462_008000 [Penicillium macrosclerotiorum]